MKYVMTMIDFYKPIGSGRGSPYFFDNGSFYL